MPVKKLKDFLDSQKVRYITARHSTAYTAQDIAASAHIPGKELAKTVMVKIDGQMAMAVLPASYRVDFDLLRHVSGATTVEMATEEEFKDLFPGCNVGAMPPFGNLYGMPVYVAQSLAEDEERHLRGLALILEQEYPQAISLLSRAVELRPKHTDWRYQLAVLLKHEDRIHEARDQAEVCVHLEPANQTYRRLLREISRTLLLNGHSSAADSEVTF